MDERGPRIGNAFPPLPADERGDDCCCVPAAGLHLAIPSPLLLDTPVLLLLLVLLLVFLLFTPYWGAPPSEGEGAAVARKFEAEGASRRGFAYRPPRCDVVEVVEIGEEEMAVEYGIVIEEIFIILVITLIYISVLFLFLFF